MFGLFRKKKKEEAKTQETMAKDRYEVYRLMSPEDLEREATEREAKANQIAERWNNMSAEERDKSMDIYYECFNLRKEAKFLRKLKNDPNASAPELFSAMPTKTKNNIQPYTGKIKKGKWWN